MYSCALQPRKAGGPPTMDEFSPGCLFGWILVALGMAAAAYAALRAVKRSRARSKARLSSFEHFLASHGADPSVVTAPPSDLPGFDLLKPKLPGRLVQGTKDGRTYLVFDHSARQKGVVGTNFEIITVGDDRSEATRHSVVCIRSPKLACPRFELLPNVGDPLDADVASRTEAERSRARHQQGASATVTKVGLDLVDSLSRAVMATRQRPNRVSIAGWEELEQHHAIHTQDPQGLQAALGPEARSAVGRSPGLIVAGEGQWLLFSRYVGAPPAQRDGFGHGLLEEEQVRQLVNEAIELESLLSRRS